MHFYIFDSQDYVILIKILPIFIYDAVVAKIQQKTLPIYQQKSWRWSTVVLLWPSGTTGSDVLQFILNQMMDSTLAGKLEKFQVV